MFVCVVVGLCEDSNHGGARLRWQNVEWLGAVVGGMQKKEHEQREQRPEKDGGALGSIDDDRGSHFDNSRFCPPIPWPKHRLTERRRLVHAAWWITGRMLEMC